MSHYSSSKKKTSQASVKAFRGPKLNSSLKRLQRKIFTRTKNPRGGIDPYKIVNVKCQLPSPTSLSRKTRETTEKRVNPIERQIKKGGDPNLVKFRERQQMIKEKYSPRMTEIYINPRKNIPLSTPKTQSVKSLPRSGKTNKTFYTEIPPVSIDRKSQSKEEKKEDRFETTADEILSEAHKMIWFWLFNGLFPTNLQRNVISLKKYKKE